MCKTQSSQTQYAMQIVQLLPYVLFFIILARARAHTHVKDKSFFLGTSALLGGAWDVTPSALPV